MQASLALFSPPTFIGGLQFGLTKPIYLFRQTVLALPRYGVMRFKETLHERSLPVGRVFPNLPTVCVWNGGPARIRYVDVKNRGRSLGRLPSSWQFRSRV